MSKLWRKLDNTAKIFSLDQKNNKNTFRLSVLLKEKIEFEVLKLAVIKTMKTYPSYKVKIKTGFFWNYLEDNKKMPIVEEENGFTCKIVDLRKNNDYLFKVTYFDNRINLDVFHVLTDGMGAITLLKGILSNYFDLKYNLKIVNQQILEDIDFPKDEYLVNADTKLICKEENKKAFLIQEKTNLVNNKTYHYVFNLEKFKKICKKNNVSITEYLTALYIYSIYKSVYDKSSNKDIRVTVPIDLRSYYKVQSFSNFFACMNIESNVLNNQNVSFNQILNQVHNEFKNKLTEENIKKYLARDVKLGTNIGIRLVPLFIKKLFIKYLGKLVTSSSTTTLSNIGSISLEEDYQKYIDNIIALVKPGKIQKVKCTVCSYKNNLTVTINSNLINNKLEDEFSKLLKEYIGDFKLESYIF